MLHKEVFAYTLTYKLILIYLWYCQYISQSVVIAIIIDNVPVITSDLTCSGVSRPWAVSYWTMGLCGWGPAAECPRLLCLCTHLEPPTAHLCLPAFLTLRLRKWLCRFRLHFLAGLVIDAPAPVGTLDGHDCGICNKDAWFWDETSHLLPEIFPFIVLFQGFGPLGQWWILLWITIAVRQCCKNNNLENYEFSRSTFEFLHKLYSKMSGSLLCVIQQEIHSVRW